MNATARPFGRLLGFVVVGAFASAAFGAPSDEELRERVDRVLRSVPLVDGHIDVPWQYRTRVRNHLSELDFSADLSALRPPMHTDLPRLAAGGMGGVFWSVYTPTSTGGPGAARVVLEQIDLVHRLVETFPAQLEMAYTSADVERIHAAGKVASPDRDGRWSLHREFARRAAHALPRGCPLHDSRAQRQHGLDPVVHRRSDGARGHPVWPGGGP